jgi:hypothetical protein
MTSEQPNERSPARPAGTSPQQAMRCMQYLLGELSADDRAVFEKQLGESAELGDELLAQSELILAVTAETTQEVAPPLSSSDRRWRVVAVVSALAATFLISLIGLHWQSDRGLTRRDKPTDPAASVGAGGTTDANEQVDAHRREAMMIAQAWATDHRVGAGLADAERTLTDSEWELAGDEFNDAETFNDQDSHDHDSVLAWMVLAVADQPDSQSASSGATSDG